MYFHFGLTDYVLFQEWRPSTNTGMLFSCLAVFLIGVVLEIVKALRKQHLGKSNKATNNNLSSISTEHIMISNGNQKSRSLNWTHVCQTLFHVMQIALSYALMLVAMTFNVWLFASVVLGMGVGYFLFGNLNDMALNECCN